ncbi:MAG: WXG100 family type VII secretion target [Umezawaea sp.]
MAGNNTTLTPAQVSAMAGRHRTCADDITSQQRTLTTQISTLTTVNSGRMMQRLQEVHQEWDRLTTDIVSNLTQMATTLDSAAQNLQSEDEANASSINF